MKHRKRKPYHHKLGALNQKRTKLKRQIVRFQGIRVIGAKTKMMIKLTEPGTNNTFTLDAGLVGWAARDPKNPVQTALALKMGGPQGPLSFHVLESPEEIMRLVNSALKGNDLALS